MFLSSLMTLLGSHLSFFIEKVEKIIHLKAIYTRVKNEKRLPVIRIRSNRGREFDNVKIDLYHGDKGIE